jgi:hypothetical protein
MKLLTFALLPLIACGESSGNGTPDVPDLPETVDVSPDTPLLRPDPAGALRFDQIQTLGTHNSYHVLEGSPAHPSHDYSHPPLPTQLDAGIRHFELDLHRDPTGGPHQVYHIVGVDAGTTCATLADCLTAVRAWSLANPEHHLIIILIEPKDDVARIFDDIGQDPKNSGEDLWDGHVASIDTIIAAAFPDRQLTPSTFRARSTPAAPTVRESLENQGFPTIAETRGQVAFVLNDTGTLRAEYRAAGEGLMFVFGEVGDDHTAFVKADDPRSDPARITRAVTNGYIVRTRADADLVIDLDRRDAALASGAQLITTDFPSPVPIAEGYAVWLDAHPSQCNPVTAPPDCDATTLEP